MSTSAKRRRRHRLHTMRAIVKQQKSTKLIIPHVSFVRIVRETVADMSTDVVNIRGDAMTALQISAEDRLTEMFSDSARLANYVKRETVVSSDLRFVVPAAERLVIDDPEAVEAPESPRPVLVQPV